MSASLPATMTAAVLTGHGGLEMIEVRDTVPLPSLNAGDVLIRVGACGMNNTDVNTRTAWYSKGVSEGTTAEGGASGFDESEDQDATWGGRSLTFPRIQGADVVGRIVAVGQGVDPGRVGERVLVDPWLRDADDPLDREKAGYFGSEHDGGYAQFTAVPAVNAIPVRSDLSDLELATFPCSYSTAEYMLTKARVGAGETVLVTGASGGVGSALIQLSKRRGASVIAVAGASKLAAVEAVGADHVISRDVPDLKAAVRDLAPGGLVDVAADIVGGEDFPLLIDLLVRGGRYVTSGAIAGPLVELDLRTLYLRDLEVLGATVMPAEVFTNLVSYIERGEIRPLLAETFSLGQIREAQAAFLKKQHVGNFVIDVGALGQ